MRPVLRAEELSAAEGGGYLRGAGFIYARVDEAFYVTLLHGRPDEQALRALVRAYELELLPTVVRHQSLVDASGLDGVDPAAFAILATYLSDHAAPLGDKLTGQALVRPQGLPGAVVEGFGAVVAAPYPLRTFPDRAAALAWLDRTDASDVLAELTALVSETHPIVRALHAYLARDLTGATIADASRALGLSERSLQRALRRADTSYQKELNAAQLQAAQKLLRDTDAKLGTIALEVGCSSLQSFSALFRRHCGESPSQWRARAKS